MISPFRDGFIFEKLRGRRFAKIKPSRIYLYLQYSKFLNSVNCLPDSDALCCLLITFTKSFDPDQARHNVESGLHAWSLFQWFDTLIVLMIETFENVNSGKEENITPPPAPHLPPQPQKIADDNIACKFTQHTRPLCLFTNRYT